MVALDIPLLGVSRSIYEVHTTAESRTLYSEKNESKDSNNSMNSEKMRKQLYHRKR